MSVVNVPTVEAAHAELDIVADPGKPLMRLNKIPDRARAAVRQRSRRAAIAATDQMLLIRRVIAVLMNLGIGLDAQTVMMNFMALVMEPLGYFGKNCRFIAGAGVLFGMRPRESWRSGQGD